MEYRMWTFLKPVAFTNTEEYTFFNLTWASLVTQMVKNLPAKQETHTGLILRSGRVPGEGSVYPLLYSCLENSMNRGAWQATAVHHVTKSD